MAVEEPYGIVEGQDLQQGDFIKHCPVFIPEYTSSEFQVTEGEDESKVKEHFGDKHFIKRWVSFFKRPWFKWLTPHSDIIEEPEVGKKLYYQIKGKEYRYDVVVMTQSCDLRPGKIKFVVLCPYWPLAEIIEMNEKLRPKKMQEKIRQGHIPNYHMLHACALKEMPQGIQIVDFRTMYTVPYDFLTQFVKAQGKRLRLQSPYTEKMSQAFGNFFSRVGLPQDIPPFA